MASDMDLLQIHNAGGYGSEFDSDSDAEKKKKERTSGLILKRKHATDGVASKQEVTAEYNKEEGRTMRYHFISLDAYARHKKMVNDYLLYYGGSKEEFKRDSSKDRTDHDVVRENHKFLWDDDEEEEEATWEKRMAKKYYDKLFKEYCITDLSRYKENKIALRWRIEKEVIDGKGQFMCGNKKCEEREGLRSWEVNFGYVEHGEKKNALVKLRLCPDCSYKLNYRNKRKEAKAKKKRPVEPESKKTKTSPEEEADASGEKDPSSSTTSAPPGEQSSGQDSLWKGPAKTVEEKSREDEFDDYFEDMFL